MSALGNLQRAHKHYAEAIDTYTLALAGKGKPEKTDWPIYYFRGISYEREKRWPEAEADLVQALALYPDQPLVLNYLGYSWVDQNMNLDEAFNMLRRAVELRPTDGYIVDSLGWANYKLGRNDEAVKQLERAIDLKASDPSSTTISAMPIGGRAASSKRISNGITRATSIPSRRIRSRSCRRSSMVSTTIQIRPRRKPSRKRMEADRSPCGLLSRAPIFARVFCAPVPLISKPRERTSLRVPFARYPHRTRARENQSDPAYRRPPRRRLPQSRKSGRFFARRRLAQSCPRQAACPLDRRAGGGGLGTR